MNSEKCSKVWHRDVVAVEGSISAVYSESQVWTSKFPVEIFHVDHHLTSESRKSPTNPELTIQDDGSEVKWKNVLCFQEKQMKPVFPAFPTLALECTREWCHSWFLTPDCRGTYTAEHGSSSLASGSQWKWFLLTKVWNVCLFSIDNKAELTQDQHRLTRHQWRRRDKSLAVSWGGSFGFWDAAWLKPTKITLCPASFAASETTLCFWSTLFVPTDAHINFSFNSSEAFYHHHHTVQIRKESSKTTLKWNFMTWVYGLFSSLVSYK